ncbi:MAG: hypothetical protein GKR88_09155 [Flavobacteriaceae bacterium]|nr:MAG: hypothetical protein GKR88_09155 [Flavobacteriaceae bacterium]
MRTKFKKYLKYAIGILAVSLPVLLLNCENESFLKPQEASGTKTVSRISLSKFQQSVTDGKELGVNDNLWGLIILDA